MTHIFNDPYEQVAFEQGYGAVARIGLLTPGVVDETVGRQFYRMAPPGVTLAKASLGIRDVTSDEVAAARQRVADQARELARRAVDCIVIGGSPVAVTDSPGGADDLVSAASEATGTGIPVITAQRAAIEAMHSLAIERLVVVTAFDDTMNILLRQHLESNGLEVATVSSLNVPYTKLMALSVAAVYEFSIECYRQAPNADGLYFPGAPMPVVDAIARIEADLGTTVVSSLQATLWKGLKLSNVPADASRIRGYGRLLES